MTELKQSPEPSEIISKLRAVDLDKFAAGDESEKAILLDVAKWVLVLVHSFELKLVPRDNRNDVEAAEREVGRVAAKLLLLLDQPTTSDTLESARYLFKDLCEDAWYMCNVLDRALAIEFQEAIKCQN